MSIRPSMYLVAGIDTNNRIIPHVSDEMWDEEIPPYVQPDYLENWDFLTGMNVDPDKHHYLDQLYYCDRAIAGFIAVEMSEDAARAVNLICDIYKVPLSYYSDEVGGVVKLENRNNEVPELYHYPDLAKIAIQQNRWIQYFDVFTTDRWYDCAMYILEYVGWENIQRSDLGVYFVSDWS